MTSIGPERLQKLAALSALSLPVLARLATVTQHQSRPPGATIFSQHDEGRDVYIVLRGHLMIITYSATGREVVLHDIQPGDLVGELSAIDGEPRRVSLVTVTAAELGRIEAGAFNRLLDEEPADPFARSTNRPLVRTGGERVSAELVRLVEGHRTGETTARLSPPPKYVDLANRIDTHREAVSRTLADLQRHAVISRSRSELLIHDLATLRAHAIGLPLPPRPAVSGRAESAASPARVAGRAQKR